MKQPTILPAFLLLACLAAGRPAANDSLPGSPRIACWVMFSDKSGEQPDRPLSPRALSRRALRGMPHNPFGDLPVPLRYRSAVERLGCAPRHVSRWVNGASYDIPVSSIAAVRGLPFVNRVLPVGRYRLSRPEYTGTAGPMRKSGLTQAALYGAAYPQLRFAAVPDAHDYLQRTGRSRPGDEVIIAFFDTGFFLDHACFDDMKQNGRLLGDSDFVDRDGDVADPDAGDGSHGMETLATVAGYDPGKYMGAAWGAGFLLARTENDFAEEHVEEDNWAAALEWAEARGADIVSSSLGYRYEFTDGLGDYPFSAMDGATTIVSMAADSAISRGLIIVNAMGNDRVYYGDSSINAPADVEGVIAVGAVLGSGQIASFSSSGPTADGRIKPDLVTLGAGVVTADFYNTARYAGGKNGTSFSTPMIAGICALIKQARPRLEADGIRERLFASCRYSPYQDTVDNLYGRGIPDALMACIDDNHVFYRAVDSLGNGVPGIGIRRVNRALIGETGSMGVALLQLTAASAPHYLYASTADGDSVPFVIDSVPSRTVMTFAIRHSIVVRVVNPAAEPVAGAAVRWNTAGSVDTDGLTTDTSGTVVIRSYTVSPQVVSVSATGFHPSTPDTVACSQPVCTVTVALRPRLIDEFSVFPTVLSIRKEPVMRARFTADADNRLSYDQFFRACVRSVDGSMVWDSTGYVDQYEPVELRWDAKNPSRRFVAPGVYYVVVEYAGKRKVRKVLVTD